MIITRGICYYIHALTLHFSKSSIIFQPLPYLIYVICHHCSFLSQLLSYLCFHSIILSFCNHPFSSWRTLRFHLFSPIFLNLNSLQLSLICKWLKDLCLQLRFFIWKTLFIFNLFYMISSLKQILNSIGPLAKLGLLFPPWLRPKAISFLSSF